MEHEELDSKDIVMLWLATMFIVAGLLILFDIPARAQYGGWGIYGPYGRPPPGAYGPPRERGPRFPDRWGPQMEPCIYYGDCRGPGPQGYGSPYHPPRWFRYPEEY